MLAALVMLACGVGLGGVLWQVREGGVLIERGAPLPAQEPLATQASQEGEDKDKASGAEASADGQAEERRFVVHVDGAVANPGIVELRGQDLRVYDAVLQAGGLLDDADTSTVNLAEPLADGAKIRIPHEGERQRETAAGSPGQVQTVGATQPGGGSVLVNINTATAEELQTLSGVGEATARAIVKERERNGPFASVEDLMRVSGIGEKKFEKVRDDICV